jgi:hypothetical protein
MAGEKRISGVMPGSGGHGMAAAGAACLQVRCYALGASSGESSYKNLNST